MEEKNPAHYCFNSCGKYLGFRGWCSKKCHNEYWDNFLESVKHYTEHKEEEKDTWNLAIYRRRDDNVISVFFLERDIKTFIQKVKEDDDKIETEVDNSENHSEAYKQGYKNAMNDSRIHRNKRAGDLK